jgi:hypothetical protein
MPARKTMRELIASGTLANNPSRYLNRAAAQSQSIKVSPLGEPHTAMSVAAKKVWHEIAANAPDGWLTSADRMILELACVLTCRLRNRRAPAKNAELTAFANVLSKLGLTPTDRAKVDAPPSTAPEKPEADMTPQEKALESLLADDPWYGPNGTMKGN